MKIKVIILATISFMFANKFIYSQTLIMKTKEKIEVIFTNKLTFDDLVKIKDELKQNKITLIYKKLEFDGENHLKGISFSVDCNDGFKGNGGYIELTNENNIGFYRDYSGKVEMPFVVGFM
jgi:hypothetical protein